VNQTRHALDERLVKEPTTPLGLFVARKVARERRQQFIFVLLAVDALVHEQDGAPVRFPTDQSAEALLKADGHQWENEVIELVLALLNDIFAAGLEYWVRTGRGMGAFP